MRGDYQFAVINVGNGDTTLVAALVGSRVRVVACALVHGTTATEIRFESGTGGTPLTGVMIMAPGAALVLPMNPVGWFQTETGALLNLEVLGATVVGGCLIYEYVPDAA